MDSFSGPFETHFHNEIKTIADMAEHENTPAPGSPEEAAAGQTFKAWGKSTVSKAGMLDVVPFFLLNLDRTVEDGLWANWPPMPAPIKVRQGGARVTCLNKVLMLSSGEWLTSLARGTRDGGSSRAATRNRDRGSCTHLGRRLRTSHR